MVHPDKSFPLKMEVQNSAWFRGELLQPPSRQDTSTPVSWAILSGFPDKQDLDTTFQIPDAPVVNSLKLSFNIILYSLFSSL
mgnify:CR=1 FL=1